MSRRDKAAASTDGLSLPLPPLSLDFAIRGDVNTDGFLQRYLRKGTSNDATSAVVGKGGFGTAYRFTRDDSFTPPASMLDTNHSSDYRRQSGIEEDSVEALQQHSRREKMDDDYPGEPSSRSLTEGALRDVQASRRAFQGEQRSPHYRMSTISPYQRDPIRDKAPAVIVVKVCRTPTSGSYDELPKTGKGREEAKAAARQNAEGKPTGQHTRIVRGEARLLRYLQAAQQLRKRKGQQSYLVRLFADIPMPGTEDVGEDEDSEAESNPPKNPLRPRLLIFERLVDLDAELTPRGWAKSKRLWTVEKVEMVARDVIAGLKFLHDNHVVHGDLKPSNFMRDPKTGHVKLIDLGASRRWVRLHNADKERTAAVEEYDQSVRNGQTRMAKPGEILCEGLGSLTGSPHFMAPEVLLQAGRYLAADGMAKSVLDDHMLDPSRLPRVPSALLLEAAYSDFKRGWGVKADVWSWACSTMSLLLRTLPSDLRPSSNSICAFDFCFDRTDDVLEPLHELHSSNDLLPRFHHWARMYPLRIMSVLHNGVQLPECASVLSTAMQRILLATFRQQDQRPSASLVLHILEASFPEAEAKGESSNSSLYSVDLHPTSALTSASPNMEEAQNIDLSDSDASMNPECFARHYPLQQSFVMLDSPPPKPSASLSPSSAFVQQKYLQNRLIYSPIASPGVTRSPGHDNRRMESSDQHCGVPFPELVHTAQPLSPTARLRGVSMTSRHDVPEKKTSQGLRRLGIDFNRPLRSVRSFASYRDPTTPTQANLPQITTTTVLANASSSALIEDDDHSFQQQHFLLHDPHATAVAANASDQYPLPTLQTALQNQQKPQQHNQKRGRSWSSIFKRKKE